MKEKQKSKMEKEVKSNMKEKGSKMSVKCMAVMMIILILAISIFSLFYSTQNINMNKNIDIELARTMDYKQVYEEDKFTKSEYVEFDAFFLKDLDGDNYAEGVRGTCKEIGTQDTLYMELNVLSKGYIEDGATITINGDRNFYFETAIVKDNEVKNNYVGSNVGKIEFKQIKNGTEKLLTGIVKSGNYNYSREKASAIGNNVNKYSYSEEYNKENTIIFKGTHVLPAEESDTHQEVRTEITKEVKFSVDWYGEVNCTILSTRQANRLDGIVDEKAEEVNLAFNIQLDDTKDELNLKTSKITAKIPNLNGYPPKKVQIKNKNVDYQYEDGVLTAQSEGKYDEDTGIISAYPETNFQVLVTYPIEAYKALGVDTVEIRIPVEGQLIAHNNPNDEFQNPYVSNVAKSTIIATYRNPQGDIARFDIYVGKYATHPTGRYVVSKEKPLKMYNGLSEGEIDDTYIVKWVGNTGSGANGGKMVFRDGTKEKENQYDVFIRNDSSQESMENVSKTIGIYFSDPAQMLGEGGEIKVYDNETGVLLETFTSENWYNYTELSPYKFQVPLDHLRVETSDVSKDSSLTVYLVKEIDDNYLVDNHSKPQFDVLEHIESSLTGYIGSQDEEGYVNTDTNNAWYEAPITEVGISVKESAMTTQETLKNEVITVHARYYENSNEVKWKNGVFLLKLPKEIIDLKINSVTIQNDSVDVVSYEQYTETEFNGEENEEFIFVKIITANETEETFDIKINCDITPDPGIPTTSKRVQLYAYNENGVNYSTNAEDKYDINNNLVTTDIIGETSIALQLISPQSLLTSQTARDYDKNGSIAIAPQIAEVTKQQKEATIDINLTNNYTNTISEVKILVKLPRKENKYVINGGDLGSEFDAYLQEGSIELPDEFRNAKIYYTDVLEDLTKDIDDLANGWTEEGPEDFNDVTAFLIDLGDYALSTSERRNITYKITISNEVNYNDVSFSHHAVFFCLDTENGKYRTQTEPNKLGFTIVKKFNLELTKYQKSKPKKVSGATYFVWEDGKDEGRTKVTSTDGNFVLEGLYVEKTYCIQELKTPVDYELNSDIIKFTTTESEEGVLTVQPLEGTTRKLEAVKDGEDYKVVVEVEDEVKLKLNIIKKEKGGEESPIANVKYKLTGDGFSTTGRILSTDAKGEINLSGLTIGSEYTLEEIRAEGYYLASQIKFTVTNSLGEYEEDVSVGNVKVHRVDEDDSIPTLYLEIEDEKIPTYNLIIKKVEEGNPSKLLAGAKFRLMKDEKEIGIYETGTEGENLGKITINGLYAFEESKEVEQIYTLQEILGPTGYAKMHDIKFRVVKNSDGLKLEPIEGEISSIEVAGSNITIQLEDTPSFKLTKTDEKTGLFLPDTKFVLYNVDEGSVPARDSKGEILGQKEEINGKEYYVLTTNSVGEITADLPEGFYKAVEVKASDDKYALADEIYFGIGMSREAPTILKTQWATSIFGEKNEQIETISKTSDGGYILGGSFNSSTVQVEGEELKNIGTNNEGMVVKLGPNNEVEWTSLISGNLYENIYSVTELVGGGYVAVGNFNSGKANVGTLTINNTGSTYDGMIIRYDSSGSAVWVKAIGENTAQDCLSSVYATKDGGYVVGGYFQNGINLGGSNNLQTSGGYEGMVIKYNGSNEEQWSKAIGGTSDDHITSVMETSDGDLLIAGDFSTSIEVDGTSLQNQGSSDGMLIKYRKIAEGNYELAWAKNIGGDAQDYIQSVTETTKGDYVVAGYFHSQSIQLTTTTLQSQGSSDGIIIKYNKQGDEQWATNLGGTSDEQLSSIVATDDGGFLVGGYFKNTITVEGNTLNSLGNADALLVKYSENNSVELVKAIGGNLDDKINTVAEIGQREYVSAGVFQTTRLQIGDNIFINQGAQDAFVVRYRKGDIPRIVTKSLATISGDKNEQILSSTPTSDGGYIVVGTFETSEIKIGENTLKNKGTTSYTDAFVAKYDAEGKVEWANSVGGTNSDYITTVSETNDGDYVVGGYFRSPSVEVGSYKFSNTNSKENGIIIRYTNNGDVKWATSIGEGASNDRINSIAVTDDGGYIVGGYFESASIKVGDITLTNTGNSDGMIIKYGSNNRVEWAITVKGSEAEQVNSVAVCKDGGYIVGGKFNSTFIEVAKKKLERIVETETANNDAMIIKLDSTGNVEKLMAIGGDKDEEIVAVSSSADGGYVVAGNFGSKDLKAGSYVLTDASTGKSTTTTDGMIIKYDQNSQVDWAASIGGTLADTITSICETTDRGYIVGGNVESLSIQAGEFKLEKSTGADGIVVKYNEEGIVDWAKLIGDASGMDYINSVIQTNDDRYIVVGNIGSSTLKLDEFEVKNTDTSSAGLRRTSEGIIAKLAEEPSIPEQSVIEVKNKLKTFKITTEVEVVNGVKGGKISGEGQQPYETVEYDGTSKREIRMTPNSDYEIVRITINGVAQPFTKQSHEDGNYYILDNFTQMREDKHVVVTYARTSTNLIINKKDENGTTPLAGAKFRIEEVDTRTEPTDALKPIQDNGNTYEVPNKESEIVGAVGVMQNCEGEYYFTPDEGTGSYPYKSNNQHQRTSAANSYVEINLNNQIGKNVALVVSTTISSQANSDVGYATILETKPASVPKYNDNKANQFIYESGYADGTSEENPLEIAKTYTHILEGGKTYYLYFGYYKNSGTDRGLDTYTINSVNVYPVEQVQYNFKTVEDKYVSENNGMPNTQANSYMEIDLTGKQGKYNVIVNAEIDSQENADFGYATITSDVNRPDHTTEEGRFIYISGKQKATEYTTTLNGDARYYLHFGYYKDGNSDQDSEKDTFTINSVKIGLNRSDLFSTEVETDELGRAFVELESGKEYSITEIEAPEGYEILKNATMYTMKPEGENEVTINNTKAPRLVVHHYLKGTEHNPEGPTKVAPDELSTGTMGGTYETRPKVGLAEYELATDEDGNYIIDGEPTGTFDREEVVVTYYYTNIKIPLIVHHYIEGTLNPVPLAGDDESQVAQDVTGEGEKGDQYTTVELKENEGEQRLNERYELVEKPENWQGTYQYPKVEVTYEYDVKMHDITTKVNPHKEKQQIVTEEGEVQEVDVDVAGGTISGEGQDPYEEVEHGGTSGNGDKQIVIDPDPGYQVKEGSLKVNGQPLQEDDYTVGEDGTITLKPMENVTEDKEVEVEFERIPAKVIVYHYVYDKNAEDPYTEKKVHIANGDEAPVTTIDGNLGDMYATKELKPDELQAGYTLYEIPDNSSGHMDEPVTEVKYYYVLSVAKIVIEKSSETAGTNVSEGNFINYKIEVRNEGNEAGKVAIKDSIPEGTEYKDESLKVTVGEEVKNEYTIQQLTGETGIEVTVPPATTTEEGVTTPGKVTIEFTVKVTGQKGGDEKLVNGDKIINIATLDKNPENPGNEDNIERTSPVEHTYIEPIIESNKASKIYGNDGDEVVGRDYALEGETIEYTITVTNKGGLQKEVAIKDMLSEIQGITYVRNGKLVIKVNGTEIEEGQHSISELESAEGLKVTVPAGIDSGDGTITDEEAGKVTITFRVTIEAIAEGYEKTIQNSAIVDGTPTNNTTTEVKKPNVEVTKKAEIVKGAVEGKANTVTEGSEIKYTITVTNSGTAPTKVLVKDDITTNKDITLKEGSIKVTPTQEGKESYEESDLTTNGIEVLVSEATNGLEGIAKENGKVVIEFTVIIGDMTDGAKIENIAKYREDPENPNDPDIPEKSTDKVEHTYVEPIIDRKKDAQIIDKKGAKVTDRQYALEGESIEYTITITNKGGLEKEVTVKDKLPEGVSYEETAKVQIKVGEQLQDNQPAISALESEEGIKVTVPPAIDANENSEISDEEAGKVTISFRVKVEPLVDVLENTITNIANVDDIPTEEVTTEVKKPNIKVTKEANILSGEVSGKENTVTEGSEIKYTITVTNSGTAPAKVLVKDEITNNEGITLNAGSIKVEPVQDGKDTYEESDLINGIQVTVPEATEDEGAGAKKDGKVTIEFTVTVGNMNDGDKIENIANYDEDPEDPENPEKPTDKVEHTYVEPVIESKKEAQIIGKDGEKVLPSVRNYALEGEKIEYTITVLNKGGLEKEVTVTDTLPEEVISYNDSDKVQVKVNGVEVQGEHTIGELKTTGIKVKVPSAEDKDESQEITEDEYGTVTISFTVTVEPLNEGIYESTIENTAIVDDTPTEKVTTDVNKSNITAVKTATPETNVKVTKGDTIKYTITVSNTGTTGASVLVKDAIPQDKLENVRNIVVTPEQEVGKEYTETDLTTNGILVTVGASSSVTVTFEVTVKDINNGDIIRNVATIDKDPENPGGERDTEPVEHKYIEPDISAEKSATTDYGKTYVVANEGIKYTITLTNAGELGKEVVVKDIIPEHTKFKAGSIVVTPEHAEKPQDGYKEEDLSEGIKVVVPPAEDKNANGTIDREAEGEEKEVGQAQVTFEVIVDEDATGDIKNSATVNKNPKNPDKPEEPEGEDEPTNPVVIPVIEYEKQFSIIRNAEQLDSTEGQSKLQENEVTVGDKIKYTIVVRNTGTITVKNIEVKDVVPEGTELVTTENEGKYTKENNTITWTIDEIAGKSLEGGDVENSKSVSFTVEVKYARDEYTIKNVAQVDGKDTNQTENPYKKPEPELESTVVKDGPEKIVSTDAGIYYEIRFEAPIKYFVGKAIITMVDRLPYALDVDKMKEMAEDANIDISNEDWLKEFLDGGEYNEDAKTITWVEEIQDINTFEQEIQQLACTKRITVKFIYENLEEAGGTIVNTVESHIELLEPKTKEQPDDPTEYEKVKEDDASDTVETEIEIPAKVVVHHYIYDTETQTETTTSVAPDVTQNGKVGDPYTTEPSKEVPPNYTCREREPEGYKGEMTEEDTVVIYYYELTTPDVSNEIDKTATVVQTDPDGSIGDSPQLVREDGIVKYAINYKATITNYIGKVTVEIVDTLPAKVNTQAEGVDLNGGKYEEKTDAQGNSVYTITWNETIENVDTYTNQSGEYKGGTYESGTYTKEFVKNIQVVYVDQDVTEDLVNTVTGTTKVYYPENYPGKDPTEPLVEEKATDDEVVKQEYKVNLKVVKEWEDDDDRRELRPDSIDISITEEQTGYEREETLSADNEWTFEEDGLPKYDEFGNELVYVVTEDEVPHYENEIIRVTPVIIGDDATEYTVKITNTFELKEEKIENAEITKEATPSKITSSKDSIEYTITYTAEITDYVGNATVVIEDILPYALDVEKMLSVAQEKGIDTSKEGWMEELLDGGKYTEGVISDGSGINTIYRITWRKDLGNINTYKEENEVYKVEPITKTITLIYKDLDVTEEKLENTASGRVEFDETQSPREEAKSEVDIEITGKLTVHYVDEETGRELTEEEVKTGKVGDPYTTEEKEFDGYKLHKVEGDKEGEFTEEDQTVTYYYTRPESDVTVKYVDEDGNPLADDVTIPGKVGDPYTTEEKEFDGYVLERVEGDREGTITGEEDQEVVYVYKRIPAKVVVRYLEKNTDKVLLPEDTIQGYVGDIYQTVRKVVDNYRAAEPEPDNATGKMRVVRNPNNPDEIIDDTIIVTYYYERIPSGKITVKHVDEETDEEITYTVEKEDGTTEEKTYGYDIEGNVGDEYSTTPEDIPYYDVYTIPENASGEFSESGDTVVYYYKKKPFNFSVEKLLKSVVLNGESKPITNNKSMKVEVVAGTIPNAKLEITYTIKVSNTGKIDGKAKVLEMIPQGYKLINVANYWAQTSDGNLEALVELKAGENKELEVTLRWINGESNFGIFDNTVKVTDTENEANFKDINPDDDISKAEIITSIKTGDEISIIAIVTEVFLILIIVLLTSIYYKKKKVK